MTHFGSYLRAFSIKVVQCLFSELSLDGAVQTLNVRKQTRIRLENIKLGTKTKLGHLKLRR